MKKLFKTTTIFIIQAMIFGNCTWAAGGDTLSAEISISVQGLQRAFLLKTKQLEKKTILKILENNKWNVEKTARQLGTYPQKIRDIVTTSDIQAGRNIFNRRRKEKMLEALKKNKWDVRMTAKEIGTYPQKIREVITLPVILAERQKLKAKEKEKIEKKIQLEVNNNKQQLKEKVINILQKFNWNVSAALSDPQMQKLGITRSGIYKILSRKGIALQRNGLRLKEEAKEEQEIREAIDVFLKHDDCLIRVEAYLDMPRATLNDKLAKYKISFSDIKFSEQRILPVLKKTHADISEASSQLSIDEDVLRDKFREQIARIKAEHEQKIRVERIVRIDESLKATKGVKEAAARKMGISVRTLSDWIKKYAFYLNDEELKLYKKLYKLIQEEDALSANLGDEEKLDGLESEDEVAEKLEKIDLVLKNINGNVFETVNNGERFKSQFYKTSHFKIYMSKQNIERIEDWLRANKCPFELIKKIGKYKKTINELYSVFDPENNNDAEVENDNTNSNMTAFSKQIQEIESISQESTLRTLKDTVLNTGKFIQQAI